MKNVLLIGGSSEIGLAILRRLSTSAGPVRPYLLGRNLAAMRGALADAGLDGQLASLDVLDTDAIEPAVDAAFAALGEVDIVVVAVGLLGGQAGLDADPGEAARVLQVGVVGCGAAVLAALRHLRAQRRGTLIALSSVAAERPRAGNAVYGAAKAGFDALTQGLSDSLAGSGVEVIVVRPGFVSTKMTAGLKPAPLATTADAVAEQAVGAIGGGSRTVWVPGTLRPLFSVLRHLPRSVYRRLPL